MAIRFHFPTRWLPSGGSKINFSMSNKTNSVASDSGSPTGNGSEAKPAGVQLMDHHELSPTPPASHSPRPHQDANACGVVNSQDQSHSSESGQDECRGRSIDQGQPETMISQPDRGHPTVEVPYGVSDPYLGGLLTAYGHQALMGYEMPGMTSNRVALPLNLADDGPIYVNAKQYHGILRRRQSRARLEAQNKLVKTRKPYLHESRHLHALSRVRGTGGRFLKTKKTQPANMATQQNHGLGGDNHHFGPTTTLFEIASASHAGGPMYLNPDRTGSRVFSSMSSTVQQTGGLMFGASGHRSSSVR